MSPPKKIRIDDLRNPVLSDIQKAALAHCEDTPVDLSIAAVLDAAMERTGLTDLAKKVFANACPCGFPRSMKIPSARRSGAFRSTTIARATPPTDS